MLIISMLVNLIRAETAVKPIDDMPGHLARRFQQIAVAVFLAEVDDAGYDLTPVQYVALATVGANRAIDQVSLAGLIAFDRTTIGGVVDRLVTKGLITRQESSRDRRARELTITAAGRQTLRAIAPAVEAAQTTMVRGLTEREANELVRLMKKAIAACNELSRAPLSSAEPPRSVLPLAPKGRGWRAKRAG